MIPSVDKMILNGKLFIGVTVHFLLITLISCQVLEIEDGWIEGRVMETRSGVPFNAFLAIPFGAAPVGDLRFLAPVPNQPWDGILNCSTFGPMCMQAGGGFMSEDCLQLNVFTKNLPSNEVSEPKPVIVFIHGGGFEGGTAINHGPEYLMDRDIVLVTIQYRLGAFGFIAVETPEVSGNQGLKDQTLALRWVQTNIRHFGGDPDRVTISGLLAGSLSVTAHMISPMSEGLFHNVIGLSGSIVSQIQPMSNNLDSTMEMAVRVNCTVETVDGMLNCLRDVPAQTIAQNMWMTIFPCLIFAWTPVLEPDLGQERFIVEDPDVLFRQGNFSRVNAIMGITANEFASPAANILVNPTATAYLNQNWNKIAPICFYFEGNDFETTEEMGRILKAAYLPFDFIDIRSFNNLNNLFADSMIGYGVHKFAHLANTFIDVYYYKFSYVGQSSFFNFPRDRPFGVHHGDDIQYLFNFLPQGVAISLDHPDSFIVERSTRMWEQFAWTGNPNNQTDEFLEHMIWPKHDNTNEWYLEFGNHLVEKNGLFLERFTVWDSFETNSTVFV